MPTIGEVVERLEERRFVGRAAELECFRSWVANGAGAGGRAAVSAVPAIAHVYGPGGIGKSWLLDAFHRVADELGREVVHVDAEALTPTPSPEALRDAVAGEHGDVVAWLNERQPLLIIDTFESLGPCVHYVKQEFLTGLDANVRVVFAGRRPLGPMWRRLMPFVRQIALGGFSLAESREYLARRGITDPAIVHAIVHATGGHPLAVSMASDLTCQFRITEFRSTPQWHLTLRSLVEDLLKETTDPEVRELLEAAAIVRQFDESTLAEITGWPELSDAFGRMCQLSVLRPSEHGLMLHDEVRPIIADDLRWRRPERYAELRANASAFYRSRMRSASPAESGWLFADQVYFSEHALLRALYFPAPEPGEVWVETASSEDLAVILGRHRRGEWLCTPASAPPPEEVDVSVLALLFADPACTVQVARNSNGELLAYGFMLSLSAANVGLVPFDGPIATVVRRCVEQGLLDPLRADVDLDWRGGRGGRVTYLSTIHLMSEESGQAVAALGHWCWTEMLKCDGFVACTASPSFKAVLDAMAFERVPGISLGTSALGEPLEGFVLDKSFAGNEAWIETVATGGRLPRIPHGTAFHTAVQRAFEAWDNDAALGASPLAALARLLLDDGCAVGAADAARQLLRRALSTVAERGDTERDAAHAVELLLVERLAPEAAIARMSVSRATLYRLRKRGIDLAAAVLISP